MESAVSATLSIPFTKRRYTVELHVSLVDDMII